MSRIGVLRVVMAMILTVGAVSVGAASADRITSEASATTLTGDNDGTSSVLTMDGLEMKCNTTSYLGKLSAVSSSQITLSTTLSGCSLFGLAFSVNLNECDYLLNVNASGTSGTTDIACPAGKEITITWPVPGTAKCIIHIPPQSNLGTVTWTNIGSGATREVTLNLSITGLKYDQTKGTAETGVCLTADGTTNGTYVGKIRLTGESFGAHIGIFVS